MTGIPIAGLPGDPHLLLVEGDRRRGVEDARIISRFGLRVLLNQVEMVADAADLALDVRRSNYPLTVTPRA